MLNPAKLGLLLWLFVVVVSGSKGWRKAGGEVPFQLLAFGFYKT